jgi:hypothetical protein
MLTSSRKEFCKEVVMWRTLQHPNVLPLIGAMMSHGHLAMISEWMVNKNINDFLKEHVHVNRITLVGVNDRFLIAASFTITKSSS